MMKLPRLNLLTQICLAHMVSHIYMLVLPVLIPVILDINKGITFVEIGLAISVFNMTSAVLQTPVGFLVDRIGAKRALLGGLLIGSVSFLSLGFINHYFGLISAMTLAGAANAVYHPADYSILSQQIHDKKMGRAFSLHTFSGFVGFAITPSLMLFIVDFAGLEQAFIASGLLGWIVILLLLPKSKDEIVKNVDISHSQQNKKISDLPNRSIISSPILLMLLLFLLLNLSGGSIQNFSVSALVAGYHVSLTEANIVLTAFLVMSSIGVLLGGFIADYTKKHGLLAAIALVISALLALVLAEFNTLSTLVIIFIIGCMGLLSGIIAPSRDILVKNISPKGAEGRVFGIVSTGFNIGGAVGPILFGWVLDHHLPHFIFGSASIFMILTAIIALYQERQNNKKIHSF